MKEINYFIEHILTTNVFDISKWESTPSRLIYNDNIIKGSIFVLKYNTDILRVGLLDYIRFDILYDIDIKYGYNSKLCQITITDTKSGDNYVLNHIIIEEEDEYFQRSTITNLHFTYNEQIMMKSFFESARTKFKLESKLN